MMCPLKPIANGDVPSFWGVHSEPPQGLLGSPRATGWGTLQAGAARDRLEGWEMLTLSELLSGNLLQFAIEAMAHLYVIYRSTYFLDCDFP